ncbi:MAG: peptide deformylase [Candidatus Kapaibacteriales bacterium]
MILPIYNAFHPILREKTKPIENIDEKTISLIQDMFETMIFAEGIGLAANQVGVNKSLLIVGDIIEDGIVKHKGKPYINAQIVSYSEEFSTFNEGCLSIPELREDVERPEAIQIKYYDLNMKEHTEEVDGLLARVLQHEIDHLHGILFFDRINPLRRTLSQGKLNKIRKGLIIPGYPMVLPNGYLVEPQKNKTNV